MMEENRRLERMRLAWLKLGSEGRLGLRNTRQLFDHTPAGHVKAFGHNGGALVTVLHGMDSNTALPIREQGTPNIKAASSSDTTD